MNKRCSACGREGEPGKKYCPYCGGLLVDPKNPESRPSPALGSLYGNDSSKQKRKKSGCLGVFVKIYFFTVLLAPLAAVVLCIIPPVIKVEQVTSVLSPKLTILHDLANSKNGPVAVSQELINAFLKQVPHSGWKTSVPYLSGPKWLGSRVVIGSGEVTYMRQLAFCGYPIYLSETFRIAGTSQQWALDPESGAIGRLPLPKLLLASLALLISTDSSQLENELKMLASAKSLQLLPGKVVFSSQ